MSSPSATDGGRLLWRWFLRRRLRPLVVLGLLVSLAYFGFWRYHLKRFHEVRPGVLYRVAQPTEFGLRHLMQVHRIKTVLSVRLEDPVLYRGLLDPGQPDGERESAYVPQIGLRHLQWPMGEEAYWPWLTPWQFEEFYKLFDEPDNLPVAVHCMGGRHRTGTFVAMFELEYNRRPVEQAIAEMLSYSFGPTVVIQDHNLRTYLPRPRPSVQQWQSLVAGLCDDPAANTPADYEELIRQLRSAGVDASSVRVREYLMRGRPFSLCLALRLIDNPNHPLAELAARLASRHLQSADGDPASWAAAAALVADYGDAEQQQALYELLAREPRDAAPSPRYQAMVAGVTNRYTPNRAPYLRPLLSDNRPRPEADAAGYRYCDTAVARLVSITNEPLFLERVPLVDAWDDGVAAARRWFEEHPESRQFRQLQPPTGKNVVRAFPANERDGRNWVR